MKYQPKVYRFRYKGRAVHVLQPREPTDAAEQQKLTCGDCLEEYAAFKRATREWAESTVRQRRSRVNQLRCLALWDKRADKITVCDINAAQVALIGAGESPASVNELLRLFVSAVRHNGFDVPNYRPLRVEKKTQRKASLDAENRRKLLSSVGRGPHGMTRLDVEILIGLYAGLRVGEICALQWRDIDFENSTLSVRHTLARVDAGWVLKEPKTAAGKRILPLGESLGKALKEYRAVCEAKSQADGQALSPETFVFLNRNGNPDNPTRVYEALKRRCEKLGVADTNGKTPSPHVLRHTFATCAVSAGIDVKTTEYLMGHENISVTWAYYVDYDNEKVRAAASVIENQIKGRGDANLAI